MSQIRAFDSGLRATEQLALVAPLRPLVERGEFEAGEVLSGMGEEAAVIPAIVYAELLAGVRLADTPARAASRRAKIDADPAGAGAPVRNRGRRIERLPVLQSPQ